MGWCWGVYLFFFKQKTAYELCISDWSSDVCSSDLRTYLEAKHRRLQRYSGVRHSILVPGGDYSHNDGLYEVPAPILPFGKGYRFPIRRAPWRNLLRSLRPDLIEVGDPYMTAWAALDAARRPSLPVIGFYPPDLHLLLSTRIPHLLLTTLPHQASNI